MKKYLFVILTVCLIFPGFIIGQDAKTVLKNTQKELKSLLKDIPGNKEAIKKVLSSLETDFKNPDKPDMWTEKGDIYLNITEEEEKFALLNPMYKIVFPDAPFKAKEAYMRALDAGAKDKPALKGLENAMTTISFMGSTFFDEKNYPAAFMTFDETIKIHEFIESKGGQTLYSDPEAMQLQKFYTIVSAVYGGHTQNAMRYIEELYKAQYDHYFIYDTYFQLLKETDEDKAVKVLREGREKFPEESALLYAEINYYLSKGNLEEPIGRLIEAIEKEPENISLYTTLGSVYDQLSQQFRQAGDINKSDEYFNEAYKYFSQAKEVDGNSYEAYYSLGALHYNKAASMTDEINKLAEDYSREGTKKYETIKKMMDELFDTALPYFLQSHTLNPKDLNSMIALREIYARNNNYDKVEEMKTKIEAAQQDQ